MGKFTGLDTYSSIDLMSNRPILITRQVTGAYSKIGINRNDGIVYFLNRQSPEKAAEKLWGIKQDQIDKAELPKLRASSDLAWGLWDRFEGGPRIKMIMSLEIINDDTRGVIIPKALRAMGELEVRKWPGTDFTVGSSDEAQAEAALALIGMFLSSISPFRAPILFS
jgi:hypothetical protein